ncbi:MAG: MarR family transcriptional regulator [Rhodobacteraceae bacterium]|nr:MarR family transcriptional regulator [Paracoccaceae bacterium]
MTRPYALHHSIGYQLTLTSRINERRFEKRLAAIGLSRLKWCILLAVAQEGLKNPSDIADFVGIDRTATSRALRQMEASGLVTRQNGKGDRRMTVVMPTEQGLAQLTEATEQARRNARYFATKLSEREQDELRNILGKLMEGETRDVSGL